MKTYKQLVNKNDKEEIVKVLFINQFDLFWNNSAGITVRELFGNTFCREMPKLFINNNIILYQKNNEEKVFSFNICAWREIVNYIKNEKAEIIYTTASSSKVLIFLLYIKLQLKIPVLMHYFDNWREIGSVRRKNFILKLLGWPCEHALVISEEMKNYYYEKFHGNYTTLMVGTESKSKVVLKKCIRDGKIKLMYAGGMHLGRVDALTEIENVILKHFEDVQLVIITFRKEYDKYHKRFDKNRTTFLLEIQHEEMDRYYAEADALLFVESAPVDKLNYLKYSMSTKIPEYLSSGLPIICYAKPGIACYEYFKRTGTAILASTPEEAIKGIELIRTDSCKEIVRRALERAKQDFDHDNQHKILYSVMKEMIDKNY